MRGLADPNTATGAVQRALDNTWREQAAIRQRADLHSFSGLTLKALLERLVREGRAESRRNWRGVTEYRAPQAVIEKDHVIGDDTISIDYAKEAR